MDISCSNCKWVAALRWCVKRQLKNKLIIKESIQHQFSISIRNEWVLLCRSFRERMHVWGLLRLNGYIWLRSKRSLSFYGFGLFHDRECDFLLNQTACWRWITRLLLATTRWQASVTQTASDPCHIKWTLRDHRPGEDLTHTHTCTHAHALFLTQRTEVDTEHVIKSGLFRNRTRGGNIVIVFI